MAANKKSNKKESAGKTMVLVVSLLVILMGGLYAMNLKSASDNVKTIADIDLTKQPVLGDPDAPVTIVEFGDMKCPVCRTFEQNIFPKLKADYIDTGKANFTFINFPFLSKVTSLFPEDDSRRASIYGEAIFAQNPDAYWDYYQAVYANQGDETKVWATDAFLIDLVTKHVKDIDIDQLKEDVKKPEFEEKIKEDELIVTKGGINSTPSIFVNGKAIKNWSDYDEIQNAIANASGAKK